ncbi:MAG: hypothetical protein ACRC0V_08070, partial [Fusobacteriaceae bacterium]
KNSLTSTQKNILFIIQNMMWNGYSSTNKDIVKKIGELIKETNDKEINIKGYTNSLSQFIGAIALNTSSEKVMVFRLYIQESAKDSTKTTKAMVLYSLLYKCVYLNFLGNQIDD